MRRTALAMHSVLYFVVVPGTIAGLVPRLLVGWQVDWRWTPLQMSGAALICLGVVPLVWAFVDFARAGSTPSPAAPPDRLLVLGCNRYVRNPMYVGVLLIIIGQALIYRSPLLVVYAVLFWIAVASFVRWYEEPTLSRRFGLAYDLYRSSVPAWIPRRCPWAPDS